MEPTNKNTNPLEDQKISIKVKLAALWTSLMFFYVYGDYFELYAPNKVDDIVNGTEILDSPTKLFLAALMLAIPALMIALSILLKPKINRWLNIIVGILFTLIVLMVASTAFSAWYTFYVFYAILEVLITLLIVRYAIKWPKEKTPK